MKHQREVIGLWIKAIGSIAMPLVILVIAWQFNASLEERETRVEYVRMAMQWLQDQDKMKEYPGLREWAAKILASNTPVALPDTLYEALAEGRAELPRGSIWPLYYDIVATIGDSTNWLATTGFPEFTIISEPMDERWKETPEYARIEEERDSLRREEARLYDAWLITRRDSAKRR